MRWDELAEEPCSIARTVAVIGDRWTLLILRDCFLRIRRIDDFEARLNLTESNSLARHLPHGGSAFCCAR
jgi:DNA-binding HxlR family transcriptional regulator